MENQSDLKRFVLQFDDMIKKLLTICPNDMDLKIFKQKFDIARKINPQKIILAYLKYIYPYNQKILGTRDEFESFIMDADINQEIAKNKEILDDVKENNIESDLILTKALNLKDIWRNKLNENNKEVMFTYFKVLTKLCERYVANSIKHNKA